MKKNLLKTIRTFAIAGVSLFTMNANAQEYVSIENLGTADLWKAYANWFQNNGAFEANQPLTYDNGSVWGLADLKSVLNTTSNTIAIYPNYSAYDAGSTVWSDGSGNGNRIFEGNTFVERTDLAGEQLIYSGTTVSSTLSDDFEDVAFIKIINPATGYSMDYYVTAELVPGEEWTLSTGTFTIQPGMLVQYGVSVTGLNQNPTTETANGFTVVGFAEAGEVTEPGQDEVTVTIADLGVENMWKAYANWFLNNGNFESGEPLTYDNGSVWGFDDLKSVLNAAQNTIAIFPNYSAYDAGSTVWSDGNGNGNRIFEGNTFVERTDLAGDVLTFKGMTLSSTLADDFEDVAFIKVINPATGYSLDYYATADLVPGQSWNLTTGDFTILPGMLVQYGVSVTGLNQNPTTESANGFTVVTASTAGVAQFNAAKTIVYPNPASNVLTIASENTIGSIAIYNTLGQVVLASNVDALQATLDVSSLNAGIYILNTVVNGEMQSTRFVKK